MAELKLVCDNCGSSFALSFDEDEVSYTPSHCPFCGDYYDNENEELNFNDEEEEFFEETNLDSDVDEDNDSRWN
jgi:DNA replicative helicase MCM subunit Mcm2 (Cdc46/Mcm family)